MELATPTTETRVVIQDGPEFRSQDNQPLKQEPFSQESNGQTLATNLNKPRVIHHQPNRPLPVYAPRRTKNFVARRCDPLIRLFKWFPVLFITAVLSWGYYAYVIQLCYLTIESVIVKMIYLLVFHILYVMTLWSYYQTIFTEAGRVPREFWFTVTDIERLNSESTEEARKLVCESIVRERNLPILCRTYSGGFRICEKCNLLKPDRAHHCSVCDACVLKMDHHCPWVNNCVSFTNYKFFVLFLGYAFSLCAWSALTSFEYFLRFWKNDLPSSYSKLHILFLFFVSIMFAVSLVSLYLYHLFLVFKNRSTLESFRTPIFRYGPDKRAYDLGRKKNWKQVFGETRFTWLIPVSSWDGDGQCFEPRSIDEERVANGQAGVVCSVRSRGNGTGLIVPRNPDHSPTSASVHASASAPLVSVSPLRPSTPSEVAPTGPNFIKVNYSSFENRDAGDEDAGSPV